MNPPLPQIGPHADLRLHLQRTIAPLQAAFLAKEGSRSARATASLARLRAMDPLQPAQDPALYSLIFDELPESLTWRYDEPSRGELAVAAALHLYAVHQQGKSDSMHAPGVRFGEAVRRLAQSKGSAGALDDGVVERLGLLVRTTSPAMRLTHLRALVQQFRGAGLATDHAQLAVDLFDLSDARTASRIHLRWARDFHSRTPEASSGTPTPHAQPTDTKESQQS